MKWWLLLALALCSTGAMAQNECAGFGQPSEFVRDTHDVVHQVTCIDPQTGLLSHPFMGATITKTINSVIDLVGNGCKGDGVTDDRACIASVLSAAGNLSNTVTVCITDNHVFLIGSNPGGSQVFILPTNVSLGCKGTVKIGNSFGNYHVLFNASSGATNSTYENFTVDGNATNNPVNISPIGTNERVAIQVFNGQNITWNNIKFINGNDVQSIVGNPCNDCIITGNKWSNYGIGGTFDHDSSEIYLTGTNGTVALNEFDAAGLGVRTAIEVHQDNKQVTGNIIHNYRYGIITSANQSIAHNFNITGNTCDAVYRCVYIWAVDGSYDGMLVSDNQITINRNGFWPVVNDESAIGTNLTNTFDLVNVKITGNNIRWVTDTLATNNASGGITIVSTSGIFNPTKIDVSGNKIDGVMCAGILFEPLGLTWTDISIKNNEITNPGQSNNGTTNCAGSAFHTGISLVGSGAGFTIKHSIVEGNHIADTQVTPTMQIGFHWFGVAGDKASGSGTTTAGLVSKNNTVVYSGTPALTTPYFLYNTTSPEYHEIVPNFTRVSPIDVGEASPDFPPKGSSIFDPISGRTYVQSVLPSVGVQLQSFETSQNVPASGAYAVGDIVWKSNSSAGLQGWINTAAGSPGTFVIFGTINSGTAAMTTAAITPGTCGATVTVSAPGALTTDAIAFSFNAAPASNPAQLVITYWPTSNNVNFQYCNPTAGSITPTAATLNWRITR